MSTPDPNPTPDYEQPRPPRRRRVVTAVTRFVGWTVTTLAAAEVKDLAPPARHLLEQLVSIIG